MSSKLRLGYEDVKGVFAIMPTPATSDGDQVNANFTVDLNEAARGADALVNDGVDAIMINGTFGEAATLTVEEWKEFTRTVIESVDKRVPVIAGPTALGTRTTIERARYARDLGASGLLLGRPMWNEMAPHQIIDYFKDVTEAVPEIGIIVYNNPAAFKSKISPSLWKALSEIPNLVGAKYGQVDGEYRDAFTYVKGKIQLMPIESDWLVARHWFGGDAQACWSSGASCDPLPALRLRDAIFSGELKTAKEITKRIETTYEKFFPKGEANIFRIYTIQLEKMRMTAAGYINAGPCRPPYNTIPEEYAEGARISGKMWRQLADDLRNAVKV